MSVTSAREPLYIKGSTVFHRGGDGNLHVPSTRGASEGEALCVVDGAPAWSSPTYSIAIATTTTLGGIIVGDGLTITTAGVLSLSSTLPVASTTTPLMDGTASVGTETAYARGDHVHPTDTSRQAASAILTSVAAVSSSGTGLLKLTAGVATLDSSAYLTSVTGDTTSRTANTVYAAPNGSAGTATFRTLVAADLPTVGTAGTYGQVATDAYGRVSSGTTVCAVAYGGTGRSSWTAYALAYASASTTLASLGMGTSGQLLVSAGSSAAPAWTTWTGSTSITTVGTISAGTWNGTAIGVAYGGTSLTSFTGAYYSLYSTSSTALAVLAPNTTTSIKAWTMTGTGSAGAAPAWATVVTGVTATTPIVATTTSTTGAVVLTHASSGATAGSYGAAASTLTATIDAYGHVTAMAATTISITTSQVSNLSSWTGSTSITTLGTISSGTWNGTAIGTTYGGTGKTTWTSGLVVYASSSSALSQSTYLAFDGSKLTAYQVASTNTIASGANVQIGQSTTSAMGLEIGCTSGTATTPYIDFNSYSTASDYDVRLIASGGTGTAGAGSLSVLAAASSFSGTLTSTGIIYANATTTSSGSGAVVAGYAAMGSQYGGVTRGWFGYPGFNLDNSGTGTSGFIASSSGTVIIAATSSAIVALSVGGTQYVTFSSSLASVSLPATFSSTLTATGIITGNAGALSTGAIVAGNAAIGTSTLYSSYAYFGKTAYNLASASTVNGVLVSGSTVEIYATSAGAISLYSAGVNQLDATTSGVTLRRLHLDYADATAAQTISATSSGYTRATAAGTQTLPASGGFVGEIRVVSASYAGTTTVSWTARTGTSTYTIAQGLACAWIWDGSYWCKFMFS
jgi:hypothetical protein